MNDAQPRSQNYSKPESRRIIHLSDVDLTLPAASGEVEILKKLNLSVAEAESVGIVGPSGSGKTSLIMVIAGLERATAGRVEVAGADLGPMDEDALARFRRESMGIVFQDFHLVPTMTTLENVAIPLEFAGKSDAFERAREALESVGLQHRLMHYPGQLSGGEQQRVALARACVVRPRLILADEPTGNLDAENGSHVIELLFDLRKKFGSTLLLITHDPQLAGQCERVITVCDGRIAGGDTSVAAAGDLPVGADLASATHLNGRPL